jgi:hypothetical protein
MIKVLRPRSRALVRYGHGSPGRDRRVRCCAHTATRHTYRPTLHQWQNRQDLLSVVRKPAELKNPGKSRRRRPLLQEHPGLN